MNPIIQRILCNTRVLLLVCWLAVHRKCGGNLTKRLVRPHSTAGWSDIPRTPPFLFSLSMRGLSRTDQWSRNIVHDLTWLKDNNKSEEIEVVTQCGAQIAYFIRSQSSSTKKIEVINNKLIEHQSQVDTTVKPIQLFVTLFGGKTWTTKNQSAKFSVGLSFSYKIIPLNHVDWTLLMFCNDSPLWWSNNTAGANGWTSFNVITLKLCSHHDLSGTKKK